MKASQLTTLLSWTRVNVVQLIKGIEKEITWKFTDLGSYPSA
jgi:hypothetical protein